MLGWAGTDSPQVLATLDAHPVGVVLRDSDIVLTVHGKAFVEGPSFTQTNAFMILDRDGSNARTIAAPDSLFLNGIVALADGTILAADSLAGRIWRLDTVTGTIDTWLADALLGTDPHAAGQRPGANGLKLHDNWLYVSNSSRQALYRVALDGTAPSGGLALFAQTGPIDDFAFLSDGTIAAATHGAALIGIDKAGTVSTLLDTGCDGCTAILPHGPDADLVVLTTGNLLEGGSDPARIFTLPSPVAR